MLAETPYVQPGTVWMWMAAGGWGLGGFFLCRVRWWLGLLFVPLAALIALIPFGDPDPHFVGTPLADPGAWYRANAWITGALLVALPLGGVVAGLAERRLRARRESEGE